MYIQGMNGAQFLYQLHRITIYQDYKVVIRQIANFII